MKLLDIKNHLKKLDIIAFELPNGEIVASHFHVTEIGKITKVFIDCGGKIREENVISFQLWEANDYDHRLHPEKLISIIELSEKQFNLDNLEIEVEYQGKETIGKYGLDFNGTNFLLTSKKTACLALDACNIPEKPKVRITANGVVNSCKPNSGCC
ncbi:MAG: DUF6428 family protein [Polaribacter sp.]|uniref:DUF6428 family protein n=1 Tax=Polaribacter sp. TaxID=1920175 RepID=UPI00321A3A8B